MALKADVVVRAVPKLWHRSPLAVKISAQVVIAGGLFALLAWRVDVGRVSDELRGAELWWLAPAAFFNLLSDFFRAIRWREFFRPMRVLGVPFLWTVAVLGVACNLALPLRAGEFVRMQFLRRRTGLSAHQVVATILSEKLLDIVAFGLFLVLGFVLYEEARFMWPLAVLYGFVLVGGIIGARWLARLSAAEPALLPQHEGRWRVWAETHARSFGSGLQSLLSARTLVGTEQHP